MLLLGCIGGIRQLADNTEGISANLQSDAVETKRQAPDQILDEDIVRHSQKWEKQLA